jgi:ABC-2 type transport system ATP-binding protein
MEAVMEPVACVRSLRKTYGGVPALDGIDLDIGMGITGLLGPNGAGKTTLLRILATALAPSAGSVRLLGCDAADASNRLRIRRRLGYVPQELGLYDGFSAFDFVDYVAILKEHVDRRARHDEVRRVLDEVDLGDVRSKKIRKLSGGMKRRVTLAQALLGDPALLVLDEPTVGLDPEQRLRFRQLVSRQADRRCVVLSTHMTEDVEALCDRVVVLDRGAVSFDGTPAALAGLALGQVWVADRADAGALVSWRTGEGRHRMVGDPPVGAELLPPTVQDGYLVLSGGVPDEVSA